MKKISVVINCYNEDGCICEIYDQFAQVFQKVNDRYTYEIIEKERINF